MLGVIFVLLVCFLRRGIVGGLADLVRLVTEGGKHHEAAESDPSVVAPAVATAVAENAPVVSLIGRGQHGEAKVILKAEGLTKRYGGLVANDSIDFSVQRGERAWDHRPKRRREEHILQDADLRDTTYGRSDCV